MHFITRLSMGLIGPSGETWTVDDNGLFHPASVIPPITQSPDRNFAQRVRDETEAIRRASGPLPVVQSVATRIDDATKTE